MNFADKIDGYLDVVDHIGEKNFCGKSTFMLYLLS